MEHFFLVDPSEIRAVAGGDYSHLPPTAPFLSMAPPYYTEAELSSQIFWDEAPPTSSADPTEGTSSLPSSANLGKRTREEEEYIIDLDSDDNSDDRPFSRRRSDDPAPVDSHPPDPPKDPG